MPRKIQLWTRKEEGQLIRWRNRGLTFEYVAKLMKRTAWSCRRKYYRITEG